MRELFESGSRTSRLRDSDGGDLGKHKLYAKSKTPANVLYDHRLGVIARAGERGSRAGNSRKQVWKAEYNSSS